MKILFSGGGTLGPVTPLLAIKHLAAKEIPGAQFVWVGTHQGPERELVEASGMRFVTISSGKLRRYLSIWNLVDIGRIVIGFFQAIKLLSRENPSVCISAGGFVSVPIHWAAWFLGIPTWTHQQDAAISLANRLMAPVARQITVVFEGHLAMFPRRKTVRLGNPVRSEVLAGDKGSAEKIFNLKPDLPVVFATGGGTGSLRVNQLIVEAVPQLKGICQIIHLSGKERPQELVERTVKLFSDYYQVHQFFTDEMKHAYAAADIVISRGGFGTLSEVAALGKPAIIIPKPGHQVENVTYLQSRGAVIYVNERTADGNYLAKLIRELLADKIRQHQLGRAIKDMLPPAREEDILAIITKITAER